MIFLNSKHCTTRIERGLFLEQQTNLPNGFMSQRDYI